MKAMNYFLIRILFALVISLVLIIFSAEKVTNCLIILVGAAFLVAGVVNLWNHFARKEKSEKMPRFPLEGIGSLLLGLWLIATPHFFANVLMFLLGVILMIGGLHQIISLSTARQWTPVPFAFYLVPSLILLMGLVALFNPTGVLNTTFKIIGIGGLIYSLSELFNWFRFMRHRPKQKN